jgi:hypothetical protein
VATFADLAELPDDRRVELVHGHLVERGQASFENMLTVHRLEPHGYLVALTAATGETVHAEPFDAVELRVGVVFGDEDDEE